MIHGKHSRFCTTGNVFLHMRFLKTNTNMADFHPVLEKVTEAISMQMQVINAMHISRVTTEQREVSSVPVSSSLI